MGTRGPGRRAWTESLVCVGGAASKDVNNDCRENGGLQVAFQAEGRAEDAHPRGPKSVVLLGKAEGAILSRWRGTALMNAG